MNLLLQQFLNSEGLREEARLWLRRERRIDVKFLLNHNPQIEEAHDDEEMGPYLAGVTLPHFDSEKIKGDWAAAERSERLPIDGPWLQLVDLPDGLSLLVPEEEDSTERILLFSPTSSAELLRIVVFDILESKISAFHTGRRYCLMSRITGSTCKGYCPHTGGACRPFKVYVGNGSPPRGFCDC
jgi:hypothetical protein